MVAASVNSCSILFDIYRFLACSTKNYLFEIIKNPFQVLIRAVRRIKSN